MQIFAIDNYSGDYPKEDSFMVQAMQLFNDDSQGEERV